MFGALRKLALVALSLCLAACPPVVRKPAEPELSLPPIGAPDLAGAAVYSVDPQASQLHVLVFRGGTLARLGHNHVMSAQDLSGRAWIHPQLEKSGFELSLPVNELIVDGPDARHAAGDEFPPDIPEADKAATRRNMLRADQLDGDRYPNITLRSVRVVGPPQTAMLTVRVTIKDVSRDIVVPVSITLDSNRVSATGELDILQTDFGIKPFSVALGALEVLDRLHVKFDLVALRQR